MSNADVFIDGNGQHWHWVNSDGRRRGYWRKIPWTYEHPSPAQAEVQAAFALVSHTNMINGTDKDATGKVVPANAVAMQKEMIGYEPKNPKRERITPPTRIVHINATEAVKKTLKRLLAETR